MLRRDPSRGQDRWAHVLKDGRTCTIRRAFEADADALMRNINEIGAEGEDILMERALAWMKARRVEKATLEVFATNERAIALYRKMGFEVEAVRKRHYKIRGEYVDDVMMAKWLPECPQGPPGPRP